MKYFLAILFWSISFSAWAQKQDTVPTFLLHDPSIYNKDGELFIPTVFLKQIPFAYDIAKVIIKDTLLGSSKIGFVNKKGKMMIRPVYVRSGAISHTIIPLFHEGGYWELYKIGKGMLEGKFQDYKIVSSEYVIVKRDYRWGILVIEDKRNLLLKPVYKRIEFISENKFKFYKFNEWTLINSAKEIINRFKFDSVHFYKDSLLLFQLNDTSGIMNYEGRLLREVYHSGGRKMNAQINVPDTTSQKRHYKISEKGKYGMADSTGRSFIPPRYDSIWHSEDFFVVFDKGAMGIIDSAGIVLSEMSKRFDKIFPFSEGRAKIVKAGKYGFIDQRGNVRVAPQYTVIRDFKEGLSAGIINGKWGFIDKDENIIVQPYYTEVSDFKNGVARVKMNGKWYFVNKVGQRLNTAYDEIKETGEEKWLLIHNNRKGLADISGRELLAPRYDVIQDLNYNMVIVKKGNRWGVLDYHENFIIPIEYDHIFYNEVNNNFLMMKKGKEEVQEISNELINNEGN